MRAIWLWNCTTFLQFSLQSYVPMQHWLISVLCALSVLFVKSKMAPKKKAKKQLAVPLVSPEALGKAQKLLADEEELKRQISNMSY